MRVHEVKNTPNINIFNKSMVIRFRSIPKFYKISKVMYKKKLAHSDIFIVTILRNFLFKRSKMGQTPNFLGHFK